MRFDVGVERCKIFDCEKTACANHGFAKSAGSGDVTSRGKRAKWENRVSFDLPAAVNLQQLPHSPLCIQRGAMAIPGTESSYALAWKPCSQAPAGRASSHRGSRLSAGNSPVPVPLPACW